MTLRGHVQNGVVIPDDPTQLPEGAVVRIELLPAPQTPAPRAGGFWKGQVQIADDFDQLPEDLAEALGAANP
jgi:hypothetical protein